MLISAICQFPRLALTGQINQMPTADYLQPGDSLGLSRLRLITLVMMSLNQIVDAALSLNKKVGFL